MYSVSERKWTPAREAPTASEPSTGVGQDSLLRASGGGGGPQPGGCKRKLFACATGCDLMPRRGLVSSRLRDDGDGTSARSISTAMGMWYRIEC